LWRTGDLHFGRNPLGNIAKTFDEMRSPSFLRLWFGNPELQYKDDEGKVLRVENEQTTEREFLFAVGRAIWTTFVIATVGTFVGCIISFPFAIVRARNTRFPRWMYLGAKGVLDTQRSIHTLVFGLFLVGIVGLGPMAGVLAIAFHCSGTMGKLFAEAIESIDPNSIELVRAAGANRAQVISWGVLPALMSQVVSTVLYIWEFNIRDSTVLGLIGAGGLGLLFSEAVSLFQWARLSTLIMVTVLMVWLFDYASSRIRRVLL
jgi:phosphonate ABC transporter permease subunit PhnE